MGMALKKIYVYTSWKHINIKLVMVEIKTQSNRDKIWSFESIDMPTYPFKLNKVWNLIKIEKVQKNVDTR